MTKWQLDSDGRTLDYPTLGFTATDAAILDGSLSNPVLSTAPDARWTEYLGASAETGITRWGELVHPPAPAEPTDGSMLLYDATANRFAPSTAAEVFANSGFGAALDTTTAANLTDTGSASYAAQSAAIGTSLGSVLARTYLTTGATDAANTTALALAISDAATAGLDVCLDGVDCTINDELTITTTGMRLWANGACRITQSASVTGGKGVFRISADDVEIDAPHLTLDGNNPTLDLTGWAGNIHEVSAVKVSPGVDTAQVNYRAEGWFIALWGFPYDLATPVTDGMTLTPITNLRVEGLVVDNVWAAVRMTGLTNPRFRGVRGTYKFSTGHASSGAPPHLFYLSTVSTDAAPDVPLIRNKNVRLESCHADGGKGGAAFSLRYIDGLTWEGLTADDCDGVIDVLECTGIAGGSYLSTNDTYPLPNAANGDRGSIAFTGCTGIVGPGIIVAAAGNHGSTLNATECPGLTILEHRGYITLDSSPASGNRHGIYVLGDDTDVRLVRPEIHSSGSEMEHGILYSGSTNGKVEIIDPLVDGAWGHGVRFASAGGTLHYDPDKIDKGVASSRCAVLIDNTLTAAQAPRLINLRDGDPGQDVGVIGWHTGEDFEGTLLFRGRWPSGQLPGVSTPSWVPVDDRGTFQGALSSAGILAADFGVANIDLRAQVKYGTSGGASRAVGFAVHVVDSSNLFAVGVTSSGSGDVIIVKREAGADTTMAIGDTTLANNVFHDLRVTVVGSVITAWVNGAQAVTYTLTAGEATTFNASTNHGIWHRQADGGYLRGLRVRDL